MYVQTWSNPQREFESSFVVHFVSLFSRDVFSFPIINNIAHNGNIMGTIPPDLASMTALTYMDFGEFGNFNRVSGRNFISHYS